MILPTARAALVALAGLPVALFVGVTRADAWVLGLLWPALVLGALLADVLLVRKPGAVAVEADVPGGMEVGRAAVVAVEATGLPRGAEAKLSVTAPLEGGAARTEGGRLLFAVTPLRRGTGRVEAAWLRWRGPLGLVEVVKRAVIGRDVPVTPDVTAVREEAVRFFSRLALGETVQRQRGQGSEFEALREFQTGMDPRAIDWKHTARHRTLLAREYRAEQNQNVVIAVDTGRLMSEPVRPGKGPGALSRLDHAITAALTTAYVALRRGDRVSLFAYDAAPQVATGLVHGARAYPAVQRAAAGIAYTTAETNHTLGLSTLAARLDRRSLVVVITEFADPTAAELMIETVGRLTRDHLVLFVAFVDEELEALAGALPEEPQDVTRAVVAGSLLREREVVLARLRRLGAEVMEARAEELGPALLARTVAVRERGLL